MYPKKGLWLGVSIAFLYMEQSSRSEEKHLGKKKTRKKAQIPCLKLRNLKTSHVCSCF